MPDEVRAVTSMYEWLLWAVPQVNKLPRDYRFTLGDRIVNHGYETLELLLEASYTKDRRNVLRRANGRVTPVKVLGLSGVKSLATGIYHACAAKTDGAVWCWGQNADGQLGDGTTVNASQPVKVLNLTSVINVAGSNGSRHVCALRSDGTTWCWGRNNSGQLGDGSTTMRTSPVQVSGLASVKAISAGGFNSSRSCAIKTDGTAWCWGHRPGNGSSSSSVPVQVSSVSSVSAITAGSYHACLAQANGDTFCWGENNYAQLGDGTMTYRNSPVKVLQGGEAVAGSHSGTCAIRSDTSLWCWGSGSWGEHGSGADATPYRNLTARPVYSHGGPVGCADGTREGFASQTTYPEIASCSGGWSVAGVVSPKSLGCRAESGNSSANPNGTGCAAEDLCAAGWHICATPAEVATFSSTGCTGSVSSGNLFFATRQSGGGGSKCDGGANDLFGCGTLGVPPDATTCSPLNNSSNDLCSALGAPWSCPTNISEASDVTKSGSAAGGVLCCRD